MPSQIVTTSLIGAVIALTSIALTFAYQQGYLDTYIEQMGKYVFKAKVKAERVKLEAEGEKEGKDFLESECPFQRRL